MPRRSCPVRRRLFAVLALLFCGLTGALSASVHAQGKRPNILFLTADDLNWDSLGVTGCTVPEITPNLDRLAAEGLRFERAHVTVAVCQPCRSALMTGRYPHRNGAMGFEPVRNDVPTLVERLGGAGYLTGCFYKAAHLQPAAKFPWDRTLPQGPVEGRDPERFYSETRDFLERARREGKPFFLMANTVDPHRPFPGGAGRRNAARGGPPAALRQYRPDEVRVPGFLPDLPAVRQEVAQYYSSVHRCDRCVGAVLRALRESGMERDTLVMFTTDHGMAFPFGKSNCYPNSTRTPWIVRWPGVVRPGVDRRHMISGIDFMPTVLEAAGLPAPPGMDGRSYLPLLRGERQDGRDRIVTVYHETSGKRQYPMRALHEGRLVYIYNAWSDGKTEYRAEPMSGLTFPAMREAAATDPRVAERVRLLLHRVPEELFDVESDPDALRNLAGDPRHAGELARRRRALLEWMERVEDPLRERFREYLAGPAGQ